MSKLPLLPSSRRGWVVAIILVISVFLIYYLVIFPGLYSFYLDKMYARPASADLPQRLEHLDLYVCLPAYLSDAGPQWAYFTVRNKSDQAIEGLKLWVDMDFSASRPPLLLPRLFQGSTLDRSLFFESIVPTSTVSGRIPLFAAQNVTSTVTVWISATVPAVSPTQVKLDALPPLKTDPTKSLVHALIENILLPPWANFFLVAAIMIVCTLVDNMEQEREKSKDGVRQYPPTFFVLLESFSYLSFLLALVSFSMVFLWECGWWTLLLIAIGVIILPIILPLLQLKLQPVWKRYENIIVIWTLE